MNKYTPESEFIFVGNVDVPGSSTMLLPGTTDIAVVSIVRSMYYPESYPIVPQQLTVHGDSINQAFPATRRLFFTVGWIYGETLAVHAIHSEPLARGVDLGEVQDWVDEAVRRKREAALLARIERSSHIIVGQVLTTRRDTTARQLISERNPDWWRAEVVVQSELKGRLPDSAMISQDSLLATAAISFPTNPRWTALPRLDSTSTGVFLLRDSLHRLIVPPFPALVESFDLRPLSESALIDSLITP